MKKDKAKLHAFDIETYVGEDKILRPFCLTHVGFEEDVWFWGESCARDYVDWLELNCKSAIIYAHNLTFDVSFLLEEFGRKGLAFEIFALNGNIYSLKVPLLKLNFRCSFRLYPARLGKVAEIFSLGGKIEEDTSLFNSQLYRESRKDEIVGYCLRDAKIVLEFLAVVDSCMTGLLDKWWRCLSVSSLSWKIFNEEFNFLGVRTVLPINEDSLGRRAYFGGRCEIFGNPIEGEFIYHFDFPGMYATIMKECVFGYGELKSVSKVEKFSDTGFYNVRVSSERSIPVLPYRGDGLLKFPNGEFSGVYYGRELNYFIELGGRVLETIQGWEFSKEGKVFSMFSSKMLEARKRGKSENAYFKLVNNSLYGRMGLAAEDKVTRIMDEDEFELNRIRGLVLSSRKINNIYICVLKADLPRSVNSNVWLAAAITSIGRCVLMKGLVDVEENGGRVYYTDTDSIFAGYKKRVDNCRFGEVFYDMSLSNTLLKEAVFVQPKCYAYVTQDGKEVVKFKGVPLKKCVDLSYGQLKEAFDKNVGIRRSYPGIKKGVREKMFVMSNVEVDKLVDLSKPYTKRTFSLDRKTTEPISVTKGWRKV